MTEVLPDPSPAPADAASAPDVDPAPADAHAAGCPVSASSAGRRPASNLKQATFNDHTYADMPRLGPDSATWRYFGDWRGLLLGLWSGSMQNMHPKLAAGVWDHSDFFGERWQRLLRSIYPIGGVVFDMTPDTGRQVRDYHLGIKGTMDDGGRYHALDPDVFYWAHTTFWFGNIRCAEIFGPPIDDAAKRQLFEESRTWYAMYGVSMRPCPETYEDFQKYWDHMCRNVLRDHPAVRTVLDISQLPPPPWMSWMPMPLWKMQVGHVQRLFMWITTGLYDEPVREMMGLSWTARDERRLRLFGKAVNAVMTAVPARYRRHPRARDAEDRFTGRIPMDAPILEAPERNMPPADQRDNPMHYCPVNAQRRANLPWQSNEV